MTSIFGISVVIPTLDRPAALVDTVRDILAQDYDDWELIIVDQSAEVNHPVLELLRNVPAATRYFHARFRGLPQARNFGWQNASKAIVVYIDDDIRCQPDFLRAHAEAHRATDASLIAGGITEARGNLDRPGGTGTFNWWTATPHRNFHRTTAQPCLQAPGGNFSVRHTAMEAVGGLDEALAVGAALYEETELALRLAHSGHAAWFAPEAHLTHLAAPTGGCRVANDVARYMYGFAHNRAIVIFRHLRWWHRPSAIARLLLFGVSYSLAEWSLRPLWATILGIGPGRLVARSGPLSEDLLADEIEIVQSEEELSESRSN